VQKWGKEEEQESGWVGSLSVYTCNTRQKPIPHYPHSLNYLPSFKYQFQIVQNYIDWIKDLGYNVSHMSLNRK
jgi:hypothetical protein